MSLREINAREATMARLRLCISPAVDRAVCRPILNVEQSAEITVMPKERVRVHQHELLVRTVEIWPSA
jgi:hypothetical protein